MGKLDFFKVSHFTLKPRKMVKFKIFLLSATLWLDLTSFPLFQSWAILFRLTERRIFMSTLDKLTACDRNAISMLSSESALSPAQTVYFPSSSHVRTIM